MPRRCYMTRTLMLTVFPASAVWPQLAGSSVVGTLTDPSGLPLLGVSVHCRHQNTGHLRETGTNERGDFTLSSLDPGPYTLTFSAPGFKTKQLQDVVVVTGAKLPVGQVLLELGVVTEKLIFNYAHRPSTHSTTRSSPRLTLPLYSIRPLASRPTANSAPSRPRATPVRCN